MKSSLDYKSLKRIVIRLRYYLMFLGVFFLSSGIIAFQLYGAYTKTSQDIALKQTQLNDIKRKSQMVNQNTITTVANSSREINAFMPSELDLYSTLVFVDNIAQKANLRVGTIVLEKKPSNQGTVEKKDVNLLGDISFEEFLTFLEKYKYITGRLLVVKNVNITTLRNDTISVGAEIYSYEPIVNLDNLIINELTEKERAMLSKIVDVNKNPVSTAEGQVNDLYEAKENPFR
ncbi:MAG: hypothetical protein NUV52_02790 [Candidatus Roizmanbacteria bacterium]|nr:hypothetical protein [Candidatus Roizmanbacteria bacterium]